MENTKILVTVSVEMRDELRRVSKKNQRTMSSQVRYLIDKYLKQE